MARFLLSLLIGAALLAGIPAQAFWQSRDSNYNISIASGSSYVGPGDVVSGATAWYSCTRGYSAAYSTGSNKACNVRRGSDNTTQDINILANGNFDVASYNTFVGTDATGTCTIASTTLTCTGLSTALHTNDPISGSGIGQPCYLTAVNTFTSGSQTATINSATLCGTVSAGITVTAQVAGFVTDAYNQAGTTPCSGSTACDLAQATAGNQPQLVPLCLNAGTVPCMVALASSTIILTSATTFTPNAAVKATYSFVARRQSGTSAALFIESNGSNNRLQGSSSGNWILVGGSSGSITIPASEAVTHAANVIGHGASSVANLDGAETTGTVTLNATAGTPAAVGSVAVTVMFEGETGFWDNLAFTTGAGSQAALVCRNQGNYYGTTKGTNC